MKGDWPNVSSFVKQSSQNDGDFSFFWGGWLPRSHPTERRRSNFMQDVWQVMGYLAPELVRWSSDRVGKWPIAGVWYMRFIKLPGTSSYGTCKFLSIYGLRCHPSGASAVKQETHRNPWASSVPLGPVTGREWRSVFRSWGWCCWRRFLLWPPGASKGHVKVMF